MADWFDFDRNRPHDLPQRLLRILRGWLASPPVSEGGREALVPLALQWCTGTRPQPPPYRDDARGRCALRWRDALLVSSVLQRPLGRYAQRLQAAAPAGDGAARTDGRDGKGEALPGR